MITILEAIAAALIGWLGKWFGKRQADAQAAKTINNELQADADAAKLRDQSAAAEQAARESTDEALSRVDAASAGPDGLRSAAAEVQSAIDRANASVELR